MGKLYKRAVQLRKDRHARLAFAAVVSLLCLAVLLATNSAMRLPAFTQQKTTYCGVSGHEHSLQCYSDPHADVETEREWTQSLPSEQGESPAEAIVNVARSQLGYAESERNYRAQDDGSVLGYTRYGAWDGDPYEEWSTAFVGFCLHYAGIDQGRMPWDRNLVAWTEALRNAGAYEEGVSTAALPLPGDIAFFMDSGGSCKAGIVEEVEADSGIVRVIAGNAAKEVAEVELSAGDGSIVGLAPLPDELLPKGAKRVATLGGQGAKAVDATDNAEQNEASVKSDTTKLEAQVDDLRVSVEASLPEGEEYALRVERVSPTPEHIRQIEDAQSESLPDGVQKRAHVGSDVLMLDISIVDGRGNEVEPREQARVRVEHARAPDAVVHFDDTGATGLDAKPANEGFEFKTPGFSAFAFAFTVDFYYEGYEYHLPGEESIMLSELFAALGIHERAADVAELTFSNPALVSTTREGGDWRLVSLAPFDTHEKLTARTGGGDVYMVDVTDAKGYYFQMNVNDVAAGCVYERSSNYGPEVVEAVTNAGECANAVRPRSADEPTNGNLSATRGFYFVGWLKDGYTIYGLGATGDGVGKGDLYSIRPSIAEGNVYERTQTFTACFAPNNEYIVTFDKYIWADENNPVNGTVLQGGAKTFTYRDENADNQNVYFCYTNSAYGAVAVPNYDSKFIGWYESGTNNLICESEWFVPPADLNRHVTVQARFVKAELYTVMYRSYDSQDKNVTRGSITIEGTSITGVNVTEEIYERRTPSGATAADYNGYTFVAWRDASSAILTRDHTLSNLPAITEDVEYRAEYLRNTVSRMLFTVEPSGTGQIIQSGRDVTDQWYGSNNYLPAVDGYITLKHGVTAVSKNGYRFDHWEINGVRMDTTSNSLRTFDKPYDGQNIQELVAVFVPISTITYDLSVIQQVGNNSADFQHWESVPWCSKDITLTGATDGLVEASYDHYDLTLDYDSWFQLPGLEPNNPAGDATIRVSQTNNGYNLLTHTFKGWRMKDGDGSIWAPGTWVQAKSSATFEAVWDAYLPGKSGYYSVSDARVYRYNTNTCGFFVRIYDSSFNKGNTKTYTDNLFTSRVFLGGNGQFATSNTTSGTRMDFFGNSDANDRVQIDEIDAALRAYANTSVPYTEQYSGQSNGTAYPGSTITFEQPFPSDEFMFARLRAWNAAADEDSKIQINGTRIPQDHLTTDYFDLRWYVLKDQENSWHVDGMLIPKYAKLVVRKRFEGDADAIARNSAVGRHFYIGVSESAGRVENNYKEDVEDSEYYKLEEFQLTLDPADAGGKTYDVARHNERTGTDDTVSVTKYCYDYKDPNTNEYVWVLDELEPLTRYYLGEHNYMDQSGCSTTKNWFITNTAEQYTSGNSYSVSRGVEVCSYPDGTTTAEIQTVTYTNRYTKPYELRVAKLDATTQNALPGVPFVFTLQSADGSQTLFTKTYRTDNAGEVVVDLESPVEVGNQSINLADGTYRFILTEQQSEGYRVLPASITGQVTIGAGVPTNITLDSSVTSDPALKDLVSLVESDGLGGHKYRSIIYIQNEPLTKRVEVTKRWTNGSTTPVTMQLLRNGVTVQGMSEQLSANNGWSATWDDLPAYIDGAEAIYTVREEWIGEPGGNDSVHYNASVDADGYEDYIVSQSQSVTMDSEEEVNRVYVENTPNSGQVVFSKVDESQRAVAGAEFTVYTDRDGRSPITAAAYASGTDKPRPAVFVSDANGLVTIEGLTPGTYYVRETKAPAGYALGANRTYTLTVGAKNSSITYVDNSGAEVVAAQVVNPVYTRDVFLKKTVAGTSTPLPGAVFSLHGATASGNMEPTPLRGYTELVSGQDGKVALGKLKAGVYYLVEDQAPAGYNKLESPVRLTVPNSDQTVLTAIKTGSNTGLSVEGNAVVVPNSEGVVLPHTGGPGTAGLYAAGTTLVVAAVAAARYRRSRTHAGGERHE